MIEIIVPQIQLLQSSARSTSLKLLHLRQSGGDDITRRQSPFFDILEESDARATHPGRIRIEDCLLRTQLEALAAWAFGNDGITSLQVIACGDFAYGGRPPTSCGSEPADVILCRPEADSEERFRVLDRVNEEVQDERAEIIDMYRDLLKACPHQAVLDSDWEPVD